MDEFDEGEIIRAIEIVFKFLNSTDYGYSEKRQRLEALFWDDFFDYVKSLQKTERNRIINQLCDLD